MKVIIWGTESTGIEICTQILTGTYSFDNKKREVLFYVDSNINKWGKNIEIEAHNQSICIPIKNPETIIDLHFDEIIIASVTGYKEIHDTLINKMNISSNLINIDYCNIVNVGRKMFLEKLAQKNSQWHNHQYSVAELGVFQGEFAKEINHYFSQNELYLFDTFEGFDLRDLVSESQNVQGLGEHLSNTSIEMVMNKMPHPNKVYIKQGWFPQSCYTERGGGDVINRQFCFVNIDTDLHDSVLAGLEFFYPRMIAGGIILVHDYFSFFYTGVKKAVDAFCQTNNLVAFPIGDILSIAIVKNQKTF